jgi:(1->4)-alpha-D-glucan 1-alpha-D-glucosylmutase
MRPFTATYRLQLHRQFDFAAAQSLLPYLNTLGVSDLYLSPITEARAGSLHGYDVIDPTRISSERGGLAGFRSLAHAAQAIGLGIVVDIVPNHQTAHESNPAWWQFLRDGIEAPTARWFDITWDAPWPAVRGRITLPVLGEHYAEALRSGKLALAWHADAGLVVTYADRIFPINRAGWQQFLDRVLSHALPAPLHQQIAALAQRVAEGKSSLVEASATLRGLAASFQQVAQALEHAIAAFRPSNDPEVQARLDCILAAQHYRLTFWRSGQQQLTLRRFFDITELAGIRQEDRVVREATHGLILSLMDAGLVRGVRVDHIDGLAEPTAYLHWLNQRVQASTKGTGVVLVEKILTGNERLSQDWPVDGTTGYDFLAHCTRVLLDPQGVAQLVALHGRVLAEDPRFAEQPNFSTIAAAARQEVLATLFSSEIDLLTFWLAELAAGIPEGRDVSLQALRQALCAVTAAVPVYRTYRAGQALSAPDRAAITAALTAARATCDETAALDVLHRVLFAQEEVGTLFPTAAWRRWMIRWQQLTGAAIAKGVEDTALYRDPRLLALNEVGSDPAAGPLSIEAFHAWCQERQARWPRALNTLSTHDTKRSEDVRARLLALCQLPDLWESALTAARAALTPFRRTIGGQPFPRPYLALLALQTLVAAWPFDDNDVPMFAQRLADYLLKAAREAKLETSWLNPQPSSEEAILQFAQQLICGPEGAAVRRALAPVRDTIAWVGALESLAQRAIACMAPGVPDIYQGCEGWSFSLVDPDNRRPVDFERLAYHLAQLGDPERPTVEHATELLQHWQDGRIKLFLTRQALHLRRTLPAPFLEGAYAPLHIHGPQRDQVLAFGRIHDRQWIVTVVTRFPARVHHDVGERQTLPPATAWGETVLQLPPEAPTRWQCVLTGQTFSLGTSQGLTLALRDILAVWPLAILHNMDGG